MAQHAELCASVTSPAVGRASKCSRPTTSALTEKAAARPLEGIRSIAGRRHEMPAAGQPARSVPRYKAIPILHQIAACPARGGCDNLVFQEDSSMSRTAAKCCGVVCLLLVAGVPDLHAQKPPYDVFPPAEPPYYRVRYEASDKPGELAYAVNYTIWIPPGVKTLRGVIVHQHGCGEGSCKSGLTGRVRPALAGAGEEARLRPAVPVLRAAGEGRLPDVVRPAQRLRRRVPEVPRRPRREVGAPRAGEGAVGAVGAQRRRALGRRHGAAAPGPRRRGVAAFGRAAAEGRPERATGSRRTPCRTPRSRCR